MMSLLTRRPTVSQRHEGPTPWYRTWMAIAVVIVLILVLVAFLWQDKQDIDPDVAPVNNILAIG